MVPMTLAFALAPDPRPVPGSTWQLPADLVVHDDPAAASAGFSHDELLVLDVDDDALDQPRLRAGRRITVAGRRSMARHGASALDTEVGVTLLMDPDDDRDPQALLNQAMMRLALAMAS